MVVRRRKIKRENYWGSIGTPIGSNRNPFLSNKPIDFLKTRKQDYPVNMFGDRDRDGVMNAFDCKPNNKNRQGFVDAIVGAIGGAFKREKGSISRGWSEGMAKPGNVITRFVRGYKKPESVRAEIVQQVKPIDGIMMPAKREIEYEEGGKKKILIEELPHSVQSPDVYSKETSDLDERRKGLKIAMQMSERLQKEKEEIKEFEKMKRYYEGKEWEKAHPVLTEMQKRIEGKRYLVGGTKKNPKYEYRGGLRGLREWQMKHIQQLREGTLPIGTKQKIATTRGAMRFVFPGIPASSTKATYGFQSKKGGAGRARGRPRQSYDPRYAAYGGVIAYRKAMSQRRQAMRDAMRQQEEMMKEARKQERMQQSVARMPQYERQQYGGEAPPEAQLPAEVQGATADYSQFPGYEEVQPQEQQMPQAQLTPEQIMQMQMAQQMQISQQMAQQQMPTQQMPQQFSQRPVGRVLMESQGKPYPAVERAPLQSTRQTVPYGYVEVTDAFTSKKYLKKLPQPERWSS